ncbi:MAG: transporter related protein [Subtercola sp.]|nr:transporter related protein [Subtercola sp.]
MNDEFLRIDNITKSYGGNTVLHGVSLTFRTGQVYGILGENGAGKSTLIKIISGLESADSGTITVDAETVHFGAPRDALARGISVITQEQTLVLDRSVAENVMLGHLDRKFGFVSERATRKRFDELRDRVGFTGLKAGTPVRSLSIATRQQVEILRAIAHGSRLIIMDEPTAILSSVETEQLLALIRRLAATGIVILLISHFLEDVLAVANEVTVLRDGTVTFSGPAEGQTTQTLTRHMVGRFVDADHREPAPVPADAAVRLDVRGITRSDGIGPVSLSVRAGEIVGMAGLIGSGRTEVARAIFGVDHSIAGEVWLDGERLKLSTPREAIRRGMAMVTENRKEDGLSLIQSIRENATIIVRRKYSRAGLRTVGKEKAAVTVATKLTEVKASSIEQPVWTLSGGNQQKVLFTRWTMKQPGVLIVDEPTRGVDVGAKAQIHQLIRDLAAQGIAVLVISSEIEEVMGLSHRLLVMRTGRVVNEFRWGEADRQQVIEAAFGGVPAPAGEGETL